MSSSNPERLAAAAREVAALAEAALAADDTAAVSDETIQLLVTAGVKLFAHRVEQGERYFPPLTAPDAATPTEVAVMVTELLRTVNLNLFDLSMWAGRREAMDEPPGR